MRLPGTPSVGPLPSLAETSRRSFVEFLGTFALVFVGVGTILFHAIRENDHFLIQGIVFTVIVALGVATLILDVIYPMLDPRISYRRT